jgi:general secretion pathway protein D
VPRRKVVPRRHGGPAFAKEIVLKTKLRVLVAVTLSAALLPTATQGAPLGSHWLSAAAAVGELPGQSSSPAGLLGGLFGGSGPTAPSDPFSEAQRGPLQNPPLNTAPPMLAQGGFPSAGNLPAAGARPMGAMPAGAMSAGAMPAAMPLGGAPMNIPPFGGAMPAGGPAAAAGVPGYGVVPAGGPFAAQPGAGAPAAGHPSRAACDALLVQARLRLADGDWRMAANHMAQAKTMNVPYAPQEDSPAKVEALIGQHRDLDQMAQQIQQTGGDLSAVRHRQALLLLEQAEALLKWKQLDAADRATRNADTLSRNYAPNERNPRDMSARIAQARIGSGMPSAVQQTVFQQTGPLPLGRTWDNNVIPVQAQQPARQFELPAPPGALPGGNMTMAMKLFLEGEQALQSQQTDRARQLYLQAAARMDELDPTTRDRLKGRLNILGRGQLLDEATQKQMLLRKKASSELATAQRAARTLQQNNPLGALRVLQEARVAVTKAGLDPQSEVQLLARADHDIKLMSAYIDQNRGRIELDEKNKGVKDAIAREREYNVQRQRALAGIVEQFNQLMDQQRWAEADALVKQAQNLDPDNEEPVVRQLVWMNQFRRNWTLGEQIRDDKAEGLEAAMRSVEDSSIPFNDNRPRIFHKEWRALQQRRGAPRMDRRRSPKEIEIEQKLKSPVSLQFTKAPLQEVVDYLSKVTDVNMHLDPTGLAASGVEPNTPVTINLQQEISLRSALQLILDPLRLSWVIKEEVLKITSSDLRDEEVYTITYDVADLVIPIPNFAPTVNMGLAGSIQEAYRQAQYTGVGGGQSPVVVAANNAGGAGGAAGNLPNNVLAQMGPQGLAMGRPGTGPGGLEGGNQPNFDTLIELIVTTINPQSWEEVGGPGRINRFPHNLSLVISQTQETHDQIADLLGQLRRLQDLQVTIEVKFISLNDNFFERIGVDFDFDIDDDIDRPFQVFGKDEVGSNSGDATPLASRDLRDRDHNKDVTVGLSAPGVFSADLDIPFTQDSFTIATPQFGGFQPTAGGSIGFAILSDIEAFFFIQAAQGDQRSNVLQAPKVTLFNGQSAIVQDITQSPFVISVIPVVGDFAAAYQPVIAVLSEGSFLSVQGVVSPDRRFVRMTVAPFFSTIGQVNTFSFDGQQSLLDQTSNTTSTGTASSEIARQNNFQRQQQATTVQLPSFSFITVTTTVSVPDGGTVLLGGIKRLSEGRSEFGVPILSKVPYVNRLFKNVGIGRETQSLLMMVTPRIIIQEEEEALL